MRVYHCSNVKLDRVPAGSFVTPNLDVAKSFGLQKGGPRHYVHVLEADEAFHPVITINGRQYLDPSVRLGALEKAKSPEGEEGDWSNYTTNSDLTPADVYEY